jgi:hypothetical protein
MTKMNKIISGFRAADVCHNPEMFTEIEFEANEETNKRTNKEYEIDNRGATSVTTAAVDSREMYHLNHNLNLPDFKCDRSFAATISG